MPGLLPPTRGLKYRPLLLFRWTRNKIKSERLDNAVEVAQSAIQGLCVVGHGQSVVVTIANLLHLFGGKRSRMLQISYRLLLRTFS